MKLRGGGDIDLNKLEGEGGGEGWGVGGETGKRGRLDFLWVVALTAGRIRVFMRRKDDEP